MANYNIVVNSKFNPFSFDEMLAPYKIYGEKYNQIAGGMAELDNDSSILKNIIDEKKDPIAFKMHKDYTDKLRSQADKLAMNGMNPVSSNALMTLKSKYSSDMLPIKGAAERRRALADEQRKALDGDESIVYQRMANDMSLDDFIADPEANYGSHYSGKKLEEEVGKEAENFTRELRGYGRATLAKMGLPYLYDVIRMPGVTSSDVLKAIQNQPGANKALRRIMDNALDRTGAGRVDINGNNIGEGWADNAGRRSLQKYAENGLYKAIGSPKNQLYTDNIGAELDKVRRKAASEYYINKPDLSYNNEISQKSQSFIDNLKYNYDKANRSGLNNNAISPFAQFSAIPTKGGFATLKDNVFNVISGGLHLAASLKKSYDKHYVSNAINEYAPGLGDRVSEIKVKDSDGLLRYTTMVGNQEVIVTREQFLAQCEDEASRQIAGELYDKFVKPHILDIMNVASNLDQQYTEEEFDAMAEAGVLPAVADLRDTIKQAKTAYTDPTGLSYSTVSMNFPDENSVLEKLLGSTQFAEGQIHEFGGIDENGKIEKGASVNKKDLFDDNDKLKNEYISKIAFNGKEPLLIIESDRAGDTRKYVISLSSKTAIKSAYSKLNTELEEIKTGKEEFIKKYGIQAYYSTPLASLNGYTQAEKHAIDRDWAVSRYWGVVNNNLNQKAKTTENESHSNTKEKK